MGFPFGLLSFKIEGVSSDGTTTVEVYLSEALPGSPKWYKYTEMLESWDDFSDNVTFSEEGGVYSVTITLVDGGFGDADGVANGIIIDPSGLAEEEVDSSSDGWLPSCFIETAGFNL